MGWGSKGLRWERFCDSAHDAIIETQNALTLLGKDSVRILN